MENIQLNLDENGKGTFRIFERGEAFGEMEVRLRGKELTVNHTEVIPKAEGRGFAKRLLDGVVEHARENGLTIVPLCSFVHAQFKKSPQAYEDVWKK